MKTLKAICTATILALTLAISTQAGEISTPGLTSTGDISTPGVTAPGETDPGETQTPGFADILWAMATVF